MNIDLPLLERCTLHLGPAIALSSGEDQQRMLTLSPFAVPMEQGLCLLRTPTGEFQFHGISIANLTLGIPQYVVEYLVQRLQREGRGDYRCLGYGLGLSITRRNNRWHASLNERLLAEFEVVHNGPNVTVVNLVPAGIAPDTAVDQYLRSLKALIERYL